jgi:hypothetical protein
MNERIRQLWEQAGEEVIAEYEDESRRNRRLYNEIFLPKFAELIVRECMKESMDEIVADEDIAQEKDPLIREYLTGNNQGIVDAVVRFRNHFGVEE